jgi:hypothetical protein
MSIDLLGKTKEREPSTNAKTHLPQPFIHRQETIHGMAARRMKPVEHAAP